MSGKSSSPPNSDLIKGRWGTGILHLCEKAILVLPHYISGKICLMGLLKNHLERINLEIY